MLNTFTDPMIMGGVFAVVVGAFQMVGKAIDKRNGSGSGSGNNSKIQEAEWRGEITQVLKQQNSLAERQTVLLEKHCDDTKDLDRLLREVHEQACTN